MEAHRILVLRRPGGSRLARCTTCAGESLMPHEAATLARVDTRTIYRWIETNQIHFTETEGQMLVCLGSLSDIAKSALSERQRFGQP